MKKRKLTPVIGAYDENPYILISRLINLCSRFEIDPYQEGTLRDFTKKIVNSARIWRGKGHFQQVYARGHAYGGVVKAILSSRRRNEFMRMLQREGILEVLLPEISSILSIRTRPIPGIEQARTSEEVLNCLRHLLKDKPDEAVSFEARIKLIRRRMKNSIFL